MTAKAISLHFYGSWDAWRFPCSGIYCIWSATDPTCGQSILRRLIYIGQAQHTTRRIFEHEWAREWGRHVVPGERLWFATANVHASDRDRCEAALIHRYRPPANLRYVLSFPFDETRIIATGDLGFIEPEFVVGRSQTDASYSSALLAALGYYGRQ